MTNLLQVDSRANCWLYTAAGEKIAPVKFDHITIVKNVESYDVCALTATPDQPAFTGLTYDDYTDKRLVIERAGSYVDSMRTEGVYFIRAGLWRRNTMTLTAYSPEYLLESRIVAYPAGDTNAQATDQADDMMKMVVNFNLGASSTDTTRVISGITDAPDLAAGPSVDRAFAHYNVLSVVQGLQEVSRALGTEQFFRMEPSGTGFVFTTYSGYIGMDRRGSEFVLSEDNENFELEGVGFDATDEVTFMYAGGAGQQETRWIGTASDTSRMNLSPYNRREAFYNCTQDNDQASVDDAAAQELKRRRARRIFAGKIKERKNYRYGIEWDFGDILKATHAGQTYDVMVRKVQIDIAPAAEVITARVEVV